MAEYKTPGVYVEEISLFPPSVAGVSTAIPAFIGYTQKGFPKDNGVNVQRIRSLLEYESIFGKANASSFDIKEQEGALDVTRQADGKEFLLYYALSLFFKNGGETCYVVSVGDYTGTKSKDAFSNGITALEKEDEPTLIVLTDAVDLEGQSYYELCKDALKQCNDLGDRFAILDVKDGDIGAFRTGVGQENLKYGAAYYPYVQTTIPFFYDEKKVNIATSTKKDDTENKDTGTGKKSTAKKSASDDASDTSASTSSTLDASRNTNTSLYNRAKTELGKQQIILPPSAAVAGVYASVDRSRGVWKAPANVSLYSVLGPVTKITNKAQEDMNVDPDTGKSINAIRAFPGKGTLIWGARTLAGNDNEWRYVNVRRLFNFIEESAEKATAFAVFEPNDASTWLKVKAMIESFLYGLWEQGALAGPTPDAAYFVNVGLGKTMTSQDILEGRMIVEVGVAAVRPAEFIVLRFSHKLQEA